MQAGASRSFLGAALAVLLLFPPGFARADVAAGIAAKPAAAYEVLAKRLSDPQGAELPRLSVQQDARQILAIYDLDAAIAARPPGAASLPALLQWSEAAGKTNKAYIFARGANSNEGIEANIKEFAEEISLGTLFNVRLSVTMHQAGNTFMASLPEQEAKSEVRVEGRKRMVLGLYQQISGLLIMEFSGPPMANGSDERAATALAQDVPLVSPSFNDAQRGALIKGFAKALKWASSQAAEDLSKALAALKQSAPELH